MHSGEYKCFGDFVVHLPVVYNHGDVRQGSKDLEYVVDVALLPRRRNTFCHSSPAVMGAKLLQICPLWADAFG